MSGDPDPAVVRHGGGRAAANANLRRTIPPIRARKKAEHKKKKFIFTGEKKMEKGVRAFFYEYKYYLLPDDCAETAELPEGEFPAKRLKLLRAP